MTEPTDEPDESGNPIGKPARHARRATTQQCTAMSKRTGERCRAWALRGARTCRVHGSSTKKSKVAAAKRIAEASGYAAELLVELMADPKVDIKDRTKIAQDLLNRAGYNGKTELEVELRQPEWMKAMEQTIVDVDWSDVGGGEDIVDAEIVETTPTKAIAARLGVKPDPMKRDVDVVDEEAVARARAEHDFDSLSRREQLSRYERFLLRRQNNEPRRGGPR